MQGDEYSKALYSIRASTNGGRTRRRRHGGAYNHWRAGTMGAPPRISTGAVVLTIADLLADVLREVLVLKRRAMQNVLEVGLVLGAAVSLEPAGVNATCVRCELLTPMQ